jgi:Xaa-Pro dipeptidase
MPRSEIDRLYFEHVAEIGRRVGEVLSREGWDAVAIDSGAPLKRSQFDDQFWPFRPCPHFRYWLPLVEPDCTLLVRTSARPILVRAPCKSFWERPVPPESDAFAEALEVVTVTDRAAARALVLRGRVAFVGEDPRRADALGIEPEAACPSNLIRALDALRTRKTPYEVECIVEANRRARSGHEELRTAFAAGDLSELDLHLLFLRATSQDDPETPYKNIVALGEHAATLHHIAYARQALMRSAETLLVDAGATCRGYCSDVTRTWVKGKGAAANSFEHLLTRVEAMQQRLCAAVRVGVPYEELHDESHRQVASILREVGILRGSADEAVSKGVTRAFYPHGLGHSLGLQTHDVGCALRAPREDNPFLRNTSNVEVGQALTIEPGVYFIDALLAELRADAQRGAMVDWNVVDVLAPLGGLRIEDDVIVLEQGVRNVTREQLPVGGGTVS